MAFSSRYRAPSLRGICPNINLDVLLERVGTLLGQTCLFLCTYKNHPTNFHHTTFVFQLPRERVFVRVHRHAPPSSTSSLAGNMDSEIATMHYVRDFTSIPVPEFLGYDPDKDRRVGGAWMVLKSVDGIPLSDVWRKMTPDQHKVIAASISNIWSQLLNLRFPRIGSIYMNEQGVFAVGPMTSVSPENKIICPPDASQCGPFSSARVWLMALASGKLSWDGRFTRNEKRWAENATLHVEASPVFDNAETQRLSDLALHHVDMSLDHILVDTSEPTRIVCILDWEGARAVPLWAIRPQILFERCPLVDNSESVDYQTAIIHKIRENVGVWFDAMHEDGADLRMLLARAEFSTVAPTDV